MGNGPGSGRGDTGSSTGRCARGPRRWPRAVVAALCLASPTSRGTLKASASTTAPEAEGTLDADLRPDKKDDAWTTSSRFKHDLVELFPQSHGETVLELGAHVGHCTRVLARLFGSVLAVEHSEAVLDTNVQRTADLSNIVHLHFHTVLDDWAVFSRGRIGVVFIDAAHDYHSVRSDIERAVAIPTVHTLVLDDYGAERGVREAVADAVASGVARVRRFVGEPPPWTFAGRTVEDWEGVVLDPLRHNSSEGQASTWGDVQQQRPLEGSTWVVFPAGVFVSGYFQPHGKLRFDAGGVAASSYGQLAWRRASEYDGLGAGEVYVLQLEEPPHWRAEMKLNGHRTAAILFRSDGHELVMLREEMMRTVGEKLLSFLH
mmetsp:Transcript_112064/g.327776  ORF Transcript_112064/g.327776 Transcript_112064/m.327776 type:complete len:374 (-) Transcript_112064:145-1266(-)